MSSVDDEDEGPVALDLVGVIQDGRCEANVGLMCATHVLPGGGVFRSRLRHFRAVLSTGQTMSVISPAVAAALGLRARTAYSWSGIGLPTPCEQAPVCFNLEDPERRSIGGIVPVAIIQGNRDVVIGMDLLSAGRLIVDSNRRTWRFIVHDRQLNPRPGAIALPRAPTP